MQLEPIPPRGAPARNPLKLYVDLPEYPGLTISVFPSSYRRHYGENPQWKLRATVKSRQSARDEFFDLPLKARNAMLIDACAAAYQNIADWLAWKHPQYRAETISWEHLRLLCAKRSTYRPKAIKSTPRKRRQLSPSIDFRF